MKINLLIIWIWPHAKRIYLPLIKNYREKYQLSISGVVELASQREKLERYLSEQEIDCGKIYLEWTDFLDVEWQKKLNPEQEKKLTQFVKDHQIDAVIIATEPMSHKTYALWAIKQWLHILMDKPITTRLNIVNHKTHSFGLIKDYQEIKKAYQKKSKQNRIIFSCMAQRRYHWAYQKLLESIEKIGNKTVIPVTSVLMQHSDWQRRLPDEIISEAYHWYNEWYGKCSHSGYHFFDILAEIIKSSIKGTGKKIDTIDVSSDFFYPRDFIEQMTISDYKSIFSEQSLSLRDQSYYQKKFSEKPYGEIDAHINFTLKKWDAKITAIRLSLIHNWFSERSRTVSLGDLYKWNGRVRHETVIINQWPAQTIHYQSYQSAQVLKQHHSELSKVGWELHSNLSIYENIWITWGETRLKNFDYSNIDDSALKGYSRGHQEKSREMCFVEFLEAVVGNIKAEDLKSDILTYDLAVALMAYSYASASQKNPLSFLFPLSWTNDETRKYDDHRIWWTKQSMKMNSNSAFKRKIEQSISRQPGIYRKMRLNKKLTMKQNLMRLW